MAINIDWGTGVINVPKSDMDLIQLTPVEVRRLDTDAFFRTLKSLEASDEGIDQPDTQRNASPVLLGGITYARVLEIIDPYSITFEDGSYVVQLVGSNNNIIEKTNPNQVSVQGNNAAGLIQTAEIQYSAYQGGVSLDAANGEAGQAYPIGTVETPVNNLADAIFIAESRGFEVIFVKGLYILDPSIAVDGYTFQGTSAAKSTLILTESASVTNCIFRDCTIDGFLDGGNQASFCIVNNLNYIDGALLDCVFSGGVITLSGNQASFFRCGSGVAGGDVGQAPTIDMGGTGTDLVIRDYHGGIEIINHTSGADNVSIDMSSGRVVIDSTVSSGVYTIRGVGSVQDNSTGTAFIDTSGLIDGQRTAKTAGYVSYDPLSSLSGTGYPNGAVDYPVNNLSDALAIAARESVQKILVKGFGAALANDNLDGVTFFGGIATQDSLSVASGATTNNIFVNNLNLFGDLTGSNHVIERCLVGDLSGLSGFISGSFTYGTVTVAGTSTIDDCSVATTAPSQELTIDFNNQAVNVIISNWGAGRIRVRNMVAGSFLGASGTGGRVVIDELNAGGRIVYGGSLAVDDTFAANIDELQDTSVAAQSRDKLLSTTSFP